MPGSKRSEFARTALSFVLFMTLFLAARSSLADHYYVPSESMVPTLEVGDRILANKASYGLRLPFSSTFVTESTPDIGDVVIVVSPVDGKTLVKRVVAIGGDTIEVRRGHALRNGETGTCQALLEAPCERIGDRDVELGSVGGMSHVRTLVPPGHMFLLGDNRADSADSRVFGPVPVANLRGRAVRVFRRHGEFRWIEL